MAIAYHVAFSAYGFWLPNDPRGSWSDYVFAPRLRQFGPATKVHTRQSVARVEHDYRQRTAAKRALKYPAVVFNGYNRNRGNRGTQYLLWLFREFRFAAGVLRNKNTADELLQTL